MKSSCWKCHQETLETIGFRAMCPHCEIDLHCCVNCRFYAPGKPNDCLIPGTEFIRDREQNNFCEDFKVKTASPPKNTTNRFDSLFKD